VSLRDGLTGLIETDREEARRLLQDLTTALPNSHEAWELLAASHLRTLEYPGAIAAYRKLLAIAPADPMALTNLAFAIMASGDNLEARKAYDQAFQSTSKINAANYLAHIEHRLGNLVRAEEIYRIILARAPPESEERLATNRGLMAVLRDLGRLDDSDQIARDLLAAYARRPLRTSSWLADRAQAQTFHEWLSIADKGNLADLIRRGLAARPKALRFPETYVLPQQRPALTARAEAGTEGMLFIVKPNNGSGGQGISVTTDLASMADRTGTIVQRYIDRPYLVDGRKGHLRIYVLITQAEPLRAYIYREGIVRFAPEPYDPSPDRLSDISMHVTNTALHEGHPGLVISQDPEKDDEGVIWSLTGFLRRIDRDGGDGQAVFADISRLASGFLGMLRDDGVLARWSGAAPLRAYPPKLFGLDVLVDADGQAWLLEIQSSPAVLGAPLVNRINAAMLRTVFDMSVGLLGHSGDTELLPAEIARRELAFEVANRGLFEPLPTGPVTD